MVAELELTIDNCEKIKSEKSNKIDWLVEMGKASGLAMSVMQESSLLISDIQYIMQGGASENTKTDLLSKIYGGLKGQN